MRRRIEPVYLLGIAVLCVGLPTVVLATIGSRTAQAPAGAAASAAATSAVAGPVLEAPRFAEDDGRAGVEESAARGGFYAAPSGTVLRFAVESRQSSRVAMTGDQPASTDFELELGSEVTLRVLARRDEEVVASLAHADPQVSLRAAGEHADDETCSEVERELARPVYIRMRPDGTITGWSFPADLSPWTRQLHRGFLAQVRFVVPGAAGQAWSTEERDAAGVHSVEYRRLGEDGRLVQVQRRRSACTPAGSHPDVTAQAQIDDRSRARFDTTLGWFVEAVCDERIVVEVDGADVRMESTGTAAWRLLEWRRDVPSASAGLLELAWSDDVGLEDRARDAAEQQRSQDEAALEAHTLERLLADLDLLAGTEGLQSQALFEARELLRKFLRTRPEEFERFTGYLSDGSLTEDAIGVALSALGSVETPQGQQFLASVAVDPARSEKVRMLALLALFQVAQPEPGAESAIVAQWLDAEASADLRGTALLLLGAHARGSAERCEALLAHEARARADGMLVSYLDALGNARLYEAVEPFLAHENDAVRATAERILASR